MNIQCRIGNAVPLGFDFQISRFNFQILIPQRLQPSTQNTIHHQYYIQNIQGSISIHICQIKLGFCQFNIFQYCLDNDDYILNIYQTVLIYISWQDLIKQN